MKIPQYIDYTNLSSTATSDDINLLCNDAIKYQFKSVCVYPQYVNICSELLKDSAVLLCTVVGFPHGNNTTASKVFETKDAMLNGADEIDMVINLSALKNQDINKVKNDIQLVVSASIGKVVKVIIETCLLSYDEIILACEVSESAGADFVKTSTGFSTHGATVKDIELIRKSVSDSMGVKASGGIKTYKDCINMINAGATRIGTSSGVHIMEAKS